MSKRDDDIIDELYLQILGRAHLLLVVNKQSLKDPVFLKKNRKSLVGRMYANTIHDINPNWSGSASEQAIRRKIDYMRRNKNYNPSKDHYNSRQRCGEDLVDLIITRFGQGTVPNVKEVRQIVDEARKVHYVTHEENQKARPYMERGMSPKQAYRAARIVLVDDTQDLFGRRGPRTNKERRRLYRKYGKI